MQLRFLEGIDVKKFFLVFGFLFVCNLGFLVGQTLLYSMLLTQYGAKVMPLMTLLLGFTTLVWVFTSSSRAHGRTKIAYLQKILIFVAGTLFCAYLALYLGWNFMVIVAYVLLMSQIPIHRTQLDIMLSSLFSLSELRVLYPKITAAYSLSSIAGGILLTVLTGWIGNHQSFWIMLITFVVALLYAQVLFRRYSTQLMKKETSLAHEFKSVFIDSPQELGVQQPKANFSLKEEWQKMKHSFGYLREHSILRYLIGASILIGISAEFLTFAHNTAVNEQFTGEQITQFLALFTIVQSVCVLIFRFFFLSKMIKIVSFSRGYLVQSALYLVGMISIAFLFSLPEPLPLYLFTGVFYILGVFTHQVRLTSLNILYGLVPKTERDKARTFTDGLGEAVANLVAASLVALVVHFLPVRGVLLIALLPITLYLLLSLRIARLAYAKIKDILVQKKEVQLLEATQMLGERKGRKLLQELLDLYTTVSQEVRMKIIQTLGEIKSKEAYDFLHTAMFKEPLDAKKEIVKALGRYRKNHNYLLMYLIHQKVTPTVLRESILSLVHNRKKLVQLIAKDFLHSRDDHIRIEAMVILDQLKDKTNLPTILSYTKAGHPVLVIRQALLNVYHHAPQERAYVVQRVEQLVRSEEAEEKLAGLKLIGMLNLKKLQVYLFQNIDNQTNHKIKSRALRSLTFLNPKVAVEYFAYYLMNQKEDSPFYAETFQKLRADLRQEIIREIGKNPVEGIDQTIKNLFPYRGSVQEEIQALYMAIPQKFQA